jgi:hypothetical protein
MASRKRHMTMEKAMSILREAGWSVDVDEVKKSLILHEPSPDVNWLHLLREEHGSNDEHQS